MQTHLTYFDSKFEDQNPQKNTKNCQYENVFHFFFLYVATTRDVVDENSIAFNLICIVFICQIVCNNPHKKRVGKKPHEK